MQSFPLDGSPGKILVKVVHRKIFPVLMYAVSCDGAGCGLASTGGDHWPVCRVPGAVHRHNFSPTHCAASVWGQSPGDVAPNTISMLYSILLFAFNVINIVHDYLNI